jgi:hypothetical protein
MPDIAQSRSFLFFTSEKQEAPVLGDEQKQQAVDQPQYLAVVILRVEITGAQPCPEHAVCRIRKKSTAKTGDRIFHAGSQLVECADTPLA